MLVAFIIVLIILYLLLSAKGSYKQPSADTINTLLRQAARWTTAAQQDNNPMVAVLHANYGAAYVWALKDIATDTMIYNASSVDIHKFAKEVTAVQDSATKRMAGLCPKYAPEPSYLTKIAGEGV